MPPNLRPTPGLVATRSYTQLVPLRATAIAVFKPRVQYENCPRNYIYRFNNNVVPAPWIATRNAQFEFGRSERIIGDGDR